MHIELIDLLRCPRDHEETWLVAAFTRTSDRFIREGKLGCPVCSESYVISNGIADLRENRVARQMTPASDDNPGAAIRVAALLGLTVPGALAALEGAYASAARSVSEMTQCRVIALNPLHEIEESESVAVVLTESRIPFAANAVHGLALQSRALMDDAPRVLRQNGRLVIPVAGRLPIGTLEVARDENDIVGESVGPVVKLRREQKD
jgi:uncharacterized protein YbaR (Trm112 family)